VHGKRHQSDADAAAAVCEQRTRKTCSCTISYDIWPPRYRTLDESAIDIAISCNRYDHWNEVGVGVKMASSIDNFPLKVDAHFPTFHEAKTLTTSFFARSYHPVQPTRKNASKPITVMWLNQCGYLG